MFLPSYWLPSGRFNMRHRPGMVATASGLQLLKPPMQRQPPPVDPSAIDADVAQEETRVGQQLICLEQF